MLDENLPTYRQQPFADDRLRALLSFTHNGSEPTSEYILERAAGPASRNQYAIGLLDARHLSVVYAEVLLRPEWTQPTLSAVELRAASSSQLDHLPITPDVFTVTLHNPEQCVTVRKRQHRSWGKPDAWEFEVPERSFRRPTASLVDRELDNAAGATTTASAASLESKIIFRWRRDGRLSKDMTCYMCGRTVGGRKSKEPDITVAMFRAGGIKASGQSSSLITIYEPNMARVDVEDGKGLEIVFLLSAEAIRDLYLSPRHDVFNVSSSLKTGKSSGTKPSPPPVTASGALGHVALESGSIGGGRRESETEAETRLLRQLEQRNEQQRVLERERRTEDEQARIRCMLEHEAAEQAAAVERETQRLRREYGVATPPELPPRRPPPPRQQRTKSWRASSVGPAQEGGLGRKHHALGLLLQGGGAASGFFAGRRASDEDVRPKLGKKRSLYF